MSEEDGGLLVDEVVEEVEFFLSASQEVPTPMAKIIVQAASSIFRSFIFLSFLHIFIQVSVYRNKSVFNIALWLRVCVPEMLKILLTSIWESPIILS